jgi:hypothetical protein
MQRRESLTRRLGRPLGTGHTLHPTPIILRMTRGTGRDCRGLPWGILTCTPSAQRDYTRVNGLGPPLDTAPSARAPPLLSHPSSLSLSLSL